MVTIYKLISSDLDLTMIDDAFMLPEENIRAVAQAQAAGCLVIINSGRSSHSIRPYEEKLGLIRQGGYGISFNGSIVYDLASGEKIRDIRLDISVALEILGIVEEAGHCGIAYVENELYALHRHNEIVSTYIKKVATPHRFVDSFSQTQGEISKVLVAAHPADILLLQAKLDAVSEGRFTSVRTAPMLLELMSPLASKGSSLEFLAEYLGIPMSQVIAMGDFFNDISALKVAGLPIAVANATDELKVLAKYITKRNCQEGAFAEVVEKFILSF